MQHVATLMRTRCSDYAVLLKSSATNRQLDFLSTCLKRCSAPSQILTVLVLHSAASTFTALGTCAERSFQSVCCHNSMQVI